MRAARPAIGAAVALAAGGGAVVLAAGGDPGDGERVYAIEGGVEPGFSFSNAIEALDVR